MYYRVHTLHSIRHNLLHFRDESTVTSATMFNVTCMWLVDRIRWYALLMQPRTLREDTWFNKVKLVMRVFRAIPWRTQLFVILGQLVDRVNKLAGIKVRRQIGRDNQAVRDSVYTSVYIRHSFLSLGKLSITDTAQKYGFFFCVCFRFPCEIYNSAKLINSILFFKFT